MSAPKRDSRITFRLRPHQDRLVRTAADAARETPSELIRRATLREARRVLNRTPDRDD